MGTTTKIPWAQSSWNPWWSCSEVSPGCTNCYARAWAKRCGRPWGAPTRASDATFNAPLKWKEPRNIFVCSLSDFFHPGADKWRAEAMDIMEKAYWHTYLILTKRIERVTRLPSWATGALTTSIGLGVTVESQDQVARIEFLEACSAAFRFISVEPMLGPVDIAEYLTQELCDGGSHGQLMYDGIDWVIAGAEKVGSRPGRSCELKWVRDLRDQCAAAGVPFFLKQLAVDGKMVEMPELDGRIWGELPAQLQTEAI